MRSEKDYLIRFKITIFMMNTILFTTILKNIAEVKSGKIKHLQNWEPNENALTPSQYNYKLPQ